MIFFPSFFYVFFFFFFFLPDFILHFVSICVADLMEEKERFFLPMLPIQIFSAE